MARFAGSTGEKSRPEVAAAAGPGLQSSAYRGLSIGGDNLAFIVDEDVEHLDDTPCYNEPSKPGLGMTVAYDVEYVGRVSTQILHAQSEQRQEHYAHAAFGR